MTTTYKIFTTEGKSLKFAGQLLTTVHSSHISTSGGDVRFELNAYECEPCRFVLSIAAKSESMLDEVFDFYTASSVNAAEDYLYDFDPSIILPKKFASKSPKKATMVTADHAYYAAARRLIRELNDHASRHHGHRPNVTPATETMAQCAGSDRTTFSNRIRHLFGY